MIAMILAAGRGERLRPITDATPKALVEVQGISLLERHLHAIRAAGISRVVINLGWLGQQIVDRVGSGARFGLDVIYSPEGDDVLETGGGIVRALPVLGPAPFMVVNADVYTDMPLPPGTLADSDEGHLVLVPTPDYKARGDFDLRHGRIRNVAAPQFTFSGIGIYRPTLFAGRKPGRFTLAPLLRAAADADRLSGSIHSGVWSDVGTEERLAQLDRASS